MQKLGTRHAALEDMNSDQGVVFFEFVIATKELFGYRSEFISDTRGMGIINSAFLEYRPDIGAQRVRDHGSLVATEDGLTKAYGLSIIQERGIMFIGPAVSIYKGQIIGQNARSGDMGVNICKEKQQTNMRSKGEGVTAHVNAPQLMGLEDALEYIDDTELVEVTPKNIRIRKINLNAKNI